ncbi:MAG TPA: hypothetical protein VFK48_03045 [Usitatibacter sp.]|nr:hypothetical protein [Usitatibacter sp.]
MKTLLALSALAIAAGCATTSQDVQLAQADCRVMPLTTASIAGARPKRVDPLDQRWAEMKLAGSDYRLNQLQRRGAYDSPVEQALRDCDRAR